MRIGTIRQPDIFNNIAIARHSLRSYKEILVLASAEHIQKKKRERERLEFCYTVRNEKRSSKE